jgi:predicted glycosyltransferase
MKILFSIGHPAHVHLFKNAIRILNESGHDVIIAARIKDVTLSLLDNYGLKYQVASRRGKGFPGLICEIPVRMIAIYKLTKKYNVNILVGGPGDVFVGLVGRITGRKSIIFDDTEHSFWEHLIIDKCANIICTPSSFKRNLGQKHLRYNGYHALAHLHPKYFKPNPSAITDCGLLPKQKYVILRFVNWQACHDVGQHGLNMEDKRRLVKELEKYARVLISSEAPLPEEFEPYRIILPPDKFHHLLYYATICVTEGSTTATEAAVLGTPTIYISTLWPKLGVMCELAEKYELLFNSNNSEQTLNKAVNLIQMSDIKQLWQIKRQKMLTSKIDITCFMVEKLLSTYLV